MKETPSSHTVSFLSFLPYLRSGSELPNHDPGGLCHFSPQPDVMSAETFLSKRGRTVSTKLFYSFNNTEEEFLYFDSNIKHFKTWVRFWTFHSYADTIFVCCPVPHIQCPHLAKLTLNFSFKLGLYRFKDRVSCIFTEWPEKYSSHLQSIWIQYKNPLWNLLFLN